MSSRPASDLSNSQQTLIPKNRANTRVNVRKDPTMFDLDSMNQRTEDFSANKPGEGETNASLSFSSPGLLAIKNHANKINLTRPKFVHEKQQDVLTTVPTWISNKVQLPNLAPDNELKSELDDEKQKELATLNFGDDPIAYFFKHKDGSGHLFIYLNYAKPRSDLNFNPYDLVKITHDEITEDYFTMSSNGVTHLFSDGSSETIPLEIWIKETSIFNMIRKLAFFEKIRYWKSFRLWKRFIQNQRFSRFREKVLSHVLFHDHKFYSYLLNIMETSCDQILNQYLLCMISQKKYVLQDYLNDCKRNSEILFQQYSDYIKNVTDKLLQLDADIKDPQRVTVSSTEFQKNKNIIPTLGQLMVINEKVQAEQARRVAIVNRELYQFGNFIRLCDYIMIEALSNTCFKCWKEAESNVKQELSAVFLVSVSFDEEGKVKFTPSLQELKQAISDTLHNTFKLIETLPRIIKEQSLREHLRKTNGNLGYLYDNMPQFKQCTDSNPEYVKIEQRILEQIETDYEDALQQSQKFVEFYQLYKHGKIWSADNYFTARGGTSRSFDFSPFANDFDGDINKLVFDPSSELVFDFNKILEDIHHFKEEEQRINQFRACAVRGAIFIDSKDLRAELAPIPSKSIHAVQVALQNFIEQKIDKINKIFNFSNKRLKREPNSLFQYAENTEFLNLILEINPLLKQEISYIDDVYSLLDKIMTNFATSHIGEHTRNPLHSSYKVFQQVLQMGKNMIDNARHKYVDELTKRVGIQTNNINKFHQQLENIPSGLSKQDVNEGLKTIMDLKSKIDAIQPEIDILEHCQDVMKANIQDLSSYDQLRLNCDFDIQVYNITNQWTILSSEVLSQPFSDINISEFTIQLNSINNAINSLKDSNQTENKLLNLVDEKVKQLMQYIDELDMLSNSKMHFHHWTKLFEDCGQSKGYSNQIRIDELISLGILQNREKVIEITSLSLGESRLEAEFQELASKWKEIKLPLLESQIKTEDSLLLGALKDLYLQIADSQMELHRMISVPFAQGLRAQINELANQLDNYNKILDAWSRFQSSWVVLASFFASENTSTVMPAEANRFAIVRRRWMQIIQHTNENTTLYQVCSLPSLLEILIENNNYLEEICSQVLKKIDIKRVNFPRLFFLSDFDVLMIFSTADFDQMNALLSKMFMHIVRFEHHPLDETEMNLQNNFHTQNFQRIKLYGMSGKFNNTLIFTRNIILGGSIESWGPTILEVMKQSIMTHVSDSIYKYNQGDFVGWLSSVPKFISMLTMQIMFTRDISECFDNFENNVHTFEDYSQNIENKIQKLNDLLRTNLAPDVANKVSNTIVMMSYQRDKVDLMSIRRKNFSQKDYWNTLMHMTRNQTTSQISIEYGDTSLEFGYEFWGSSKQLIQSPQSEIAMKNIISNIAMNHYPILYGESSIGKKRLISNVASLFGRFVVFGPTFTDIDSVLYTKLFTGAIGSGAWLVMNNIDCADMTNLSNITLLMQKYKNALIENSPTLEISSNTISVKDNCRLIFVGSSNYYESERIPDNLKAVLQPVAFSMPDSKKIAFVQFLASGYLNAQSLSSQTVDFLQLLFSLFGYIFHGPIGTIIAEILKKSTKILSLLMSDLLKNKGSDDLTNEEIFNAETLSIITILKTKYFPQLQHHHENFFIDIMHSHFRIYKNAYEMTSKIDEMEEHSVDEFINDVLEVIESDNKDNYQVIYLDPIKEFLESLKKNLCVIIVGGPQTGKTTIQDLIEKAISKMCSTPKYKEKYPDLLPFQFFDIFFRSETNTNFYGVSVMSDKGPVTKYGLLHSYFNYIQSLNNCEKFIRFNGPLNKSAVRFIREMLSSGDSSRLIINTMNIYDERSHMHFILETEDISLLDPSVIGISSVIHTHSVHLNEPLSQYKGCSSFNGDIIFNRAVDKTETNLSLAVLRQIKAQFNEICPIIIKYLLNVPNTIYSYQSQVFNSKAQSLICNLLPFNGLIHALLLNEDTNDTTNAHTKFVLIYCLFHAFIPILDSAAILSFDTWAVNSFLIKIPADWVGFEVPQHFWDIFPRPSLISTRFDGTTLKPLDFAVLNEPCIKEKPMTEQPFELIDDISICTAQFLPIINIANELLKMKCNFIITGQQNSGKTNCLKYIFKDKNDMIPIFIPVCASSNATTLAKFIINHTPVASKPGSKPLGNLHYVLIFKNVSHKYIHAIEFIRSIITKKSITLHSDIDPNYMEMIPLKNFIVVVTTNNFEHFEPRFSSMFYIMKLLPQTHHSMQYIYYKVAQKLSINKLLYEPGFKIAETLSQKPLYGFNWLHTLDIFTILSYRSAPTRNDFLECVKAFLFELKTLYTHKLLTQDEIFNFSVLVLNVFTDADIRMVYDPVVVGPNLYYPEIDVDEETKKLVALFSFRQVHLVREELTFLLQQFSSKVSFTTKIYFFKPLIEQWVYLQRMLTYPGRNILIVDPSGNGKFVLTYFTATTKGFEFVHIPPRSPSDEKYPERRRNYLVSMMNDALMKVLTKNKKVCVFLRANSENDFDFKFLSSLIYEYDYLPFINEDFRKDYYLKISAKHPQLIDQPYMIYNLIRNDLRMKLKFVIQANSSWMTNYKNFESLYLTIESMEAIEICARDALDNPTFVKQAKQLPPKTSQAIASIFINISSMCPAIQIPHFFSFINTFMGYFSKELSNIEERKDNISAAIDFFTITNKMEMEVKAKLKTLTNLVKDPDEDDEEVMKSFVAKRDTIRVRLAKINEIEKEQKEKLQNLTNELNKLKQQLNNMNLKVDLDRGRVNSISPQNLNEIRLIDGTKNKALGYLMSAILSFSGQNTAFEPHGRRMINDPKFLTNVLARIKGTMFKPKTLEDTQPYIDKLDTMEKELSNAHPALPILFNWIKDVYDAAILDQKLHDKENEIDIQQATLNKTLTDNEIEKESITAIAEQIDKDMESHEKSRKEREKNSELYNEVKTKCEILEQINTQSSKLIDRWLNYNEEFQEKIQQNVSNSLLYSTMIEYWGILSVEQQKQCLNEILEIFDTNEISYNKEITIENLFTLLRLEDRYDKLNFDQLTPIETELGWRRMQMIQNPPLILDSDGFMYDFLVEHTKPKRLVTASLMSSNIDNIIVECLENGKKLLLYDVNFMGPSLFTLLQLPARRTDQQTTPFTYAGKIVNVHQKFKLYMTSSIESLNNVPSDLAARVTIINMNIVYGKSLNRIVAAHFVKRFFPEKLPRMINIERLRMQRGVEKIMFEDDVVDSIMDLVRMMKGGSNEDIFEDEEAIESLIRNKECFLSSLETKTDFESIEKEIAELMTLIGKGVKLCTSMWVSISRFSSRANKNHGFNIRKYFQMLDTALKTCKLNANSDEIFTHILHQLISYVTPQMSLEDAYVSLFIAAVMSTHTEEQFSGFEEILMHIRSELDNVCDMRQSEVSLGDPMEKLRFANITLVFPIIRQYLIRIFGKDFENYITNPELKFFANNDPKVPTIIRSSVNNYASNIVEMLLQQEQKSFLEIPTSMSSSYLNLALDAAKQAIETGKVLILHYSASPLSISIIQSVIELLKEPHKDFRLIILATTFDEMTNSLLVGSNVVFAHEFPSLRHIVYNIYNTHWDLISGSGTPQLMKRISFPIAINFALERARNFAVPLGVTSMLPITPFMMTQIFQKTSKFVDSALYRDFPMENLRSVYHTDLSCSISLYKIDQMKHDANEEGIFHSRWLEQEFAFRGKKFVIDAEWDKQQFLDFVSQLDIFCDPTFLGFDPLSSQPLFNWRMSVWISKVLSAMAKPVNTLPSDVRTYLESISTMVPPQITITQNFEPHSPLQMFLDYEIHEFNNATQIISRDITDAIHKRNMEVFNAFMLQQVPAKWKKIVGFNGTSSISKFFLMLFDKSKYLTIWMNGSTIPQEIDARYIRNMKEFALAFVAEIAIQRGVLRENLKSTFVFEKPHESSIGIRGIAIMAGNWDASNSCLAKSNNKTPSFMKIPIIYLTYTSSEKTEEKEGFVKVPLLMCIPMQGFAVMEKYENNYVTDIEVKSQIKQTDILLSGTSFICHAHDTFC